MSATTAVVVPAEKAAEIDRIFAGLVAIGGDHVLAADGIRDGIALQPIFKKNSIEAQQFCTAAGVLVAEGWLKLVIVQDQVKGFIRAYPKAVANENILRFPRRNCENASERVTPGAVVPLGRR
jgi:hypothetical protein